jgi:hypothetical protein
MVSLGTVVWERWSTSALVSRYGLWVSVFVLIISIAGMYDRPPNFLLVDYYGYGPAHGARPNKIGKPYNGSVFDVAAEANNLLYTRHCCARSSRAGSIVNDGPGSWTTLAGMATFLVAWLLL